MTGARLGWRVSRWPEASQRRRRPSASKRLRSRLDPRHPVCWLLRAGVDRGRKGDGRRPERERARPVDRSWWEVGGGARRRTLLNISRPFWARSLLALGGGGGGCKDVGYPAYGSVKACRPESDARLEFGSGARALPRPRASAPTSHPDGIESLAGRAGKV